MTASVDEELVHTLARELADLPNSVPLPTARGTGAAGPTAGRCGRSLPTDLHARITALADAHGVAVSDVLLAAFAAVLHRYGRQRDLVIGVQVDRDGGGTEVTPVRSAVVGATSVLDILRTHRSQRVRAAAHPPVSLPLLADLLSEAGPGEERALWRIAFGHDDAVSGEAELALVVAAGPGAVSLWFDRDTARVGADVVAGLADDYLVLLAGAVDRPDAPVSALPLLGGDARARVLALAGAPAPTAPAPQPVHRVVERHAALRPDTLAVEHGLLRLTYGDLNAQANRLARVLRQRGVGVASVVALYLDRCPEWLVCSLAVAKLGAIVMPLDPRAPTDRVALAAAAAPPAAAVTVERLVAADDPAITKALGSVVVLDHIRAELAAQDPADLAVPVSVDDLSHVIHTSGSTAAAKMIMIQHKVLATSGLRAVALNPTGPDDRGSWLAPTGAGISLYEVSVLLTAGASIHIADADLIASPPALRDWLIRARITQTFVVTPLGEALQSLPWPADSPLRLITLGGEKLHQWASADLPFEVTVAYGCAEAFHLANTLQPRERRCTSATASAADRGTAPPVGRPLPGVMIYIADGDLNLMPPGAVGEVWVDTVELALGYLNDPVQTAAKFRPNPFGPPGSRVYRTGDLGRYRPDGLLEHHGRVDAMVKVRGYRVELGEVERVLGQHPGVGQAAVVAVADRFGRNRLVVCVVPRPGASRPAPDPAVLRAFLLEQLPEYMVPVAYVPMAALPLNSSNKVDRQALPPPDWSQWRPRRPTRAPRDEIEADLIDRCALLLGLERVGIDDRLADLGAESLQASRLQVWLTERFGAELGIRELLQAPTLAAVADLVRARRDVAPVRQLPPVLPSGRGQR